MDYVLSTPAAVLALETSRWRLSNSPRNSISPFHTPRGFRFLSRGYCWRQGKSMLLWWGGRPLERSRSMSPI